MSQLVTINLSKQPGGTWGFRLQGGKDFAQPLSIQKVTVGSVAEQAGVRVGDSIVSIGGSDALSLRHKEAQDAIVKAGNSFQLVIQRGSSLWKPKVTPLAQPARTPQGPVATQTSLAKSQATKINIGSSHNTSPRPFPGPGTWATSPVLPQTSSPIHSPNPRGLTESTSQTTFNRTNLYCEEIENESRSVSRSISRISLRDRVSPDGGSDLLSTSKEQLLGHSNVDSYDGNFSATFGSNTLLSNSTLNSWRSPGNSIRCLASSRDNLSDLHHASFVAEDERVGARSSSPPFPPPPPPLQSVRSGSSTGLGSPVRSPSPGVNNPHGHNSSFSNRSPSPYHANCFSSRTPRSLSPSCSIPSMPSTGSLANIGIIGSPPSGSSMPTSVGRIKVLDPVSDVEKEGSLKIEGADIALDKENARNFLQMQLDKERARELYVKSLSTESNSERTTNGEPYISRGTKFSVGSPLHNRSNSLAVDNSLINAGIKNYFANKSTENIYMKSNSVDHPSDVGDDLSASGNRSSSKVSDNIKLFDGGRRHSSFTPSQSGGKFNFKSHTLGRASAYNTPPQTPAGPGRFIKHGSDTSRRVSSKWGGGERTLRKIPFSGSCSNLTYNSDEKFARDGGTNCNVPWKNHFSELRRKSASTSTPMTARTHGSSSAPGSGTKVNGTPIVNPQYNSPINLYNEDSIAEALSAQSEVLGKGCLGVNFMKNDPRTGAADRESDVLKMVQEMDRAPKTPPVSSGTNSVYCGAAPPSEMMGTPEIPVQGASFRILERYLSGEELGSMLPSAGGPSIGHQLRHGENLCAECGRLIVGVFVRIKDKNLHADCFRCNTCGTSLKNVGYYNVSDKLYCDVHAKQAAKHNPPGPNLVPVTVKPGAVPPAGAVPAVAAPKVPAPAPALATSLSPAPAPTPSHSSVAPGGSSANPAAFGAPSGGVNIRSHIPKKGTAPAPSFTAPKPAAAPGFAPAPTFAPAPAFVPAPAFAPALKPVAPVPAPSFIAPKPAAAPAPTFSAPKPAAAPAPAPMFGGGGMPKPAPPPGLGGIAKPPGPGGPPTKGIPGERTAPKRGRGIMNPAVASRIPICANCQRQIRGPFVTALGKNWCPDHFHCATDSCRKPLIDVGFVEEQGSLYCEDCYEKYLAPTCGKCDKRIKGDCLNAVGKQFHPECFCCTYCGKVFGSGAFYLEDGLPYCETDWNDLFTTKCVGCGFPIEAGDRWVEALNNNYHSQCFKCSKCNKNLEGQSFFAKGGKPFCKAHAQRGF